MSVTALKYSAWLAGIAAICGIAAAQSVTPEFSEYAVPTANSQPLGICLGPDRALWFTEAAAHKIGRIATTGSITEFAVPWTVGADRKGPLDIALGLEWNLLSAVIRPSGR